MREGIPAKSLFCLSLLVSVCYGGRDPYFLSKASRNPRVFSLFTVVRFENSACTAASSSTLTGTCMTQAECSATNGGSTDGTCAGGFGVCCVISLDTCGSTVSRNCTYIRNPGFPAAVSTASTECKFTVAKCSSDVCQFRLDFVTFESEVNADGSCGTAADMFVAMTPGSSQAPTICGMNSGMHMYLDAGAQGNTATSMLTFSTGTNTADRMFEIKVTQLPCNSVLLAPNGCLQYFTGTQGTFQSYNFLGGLMLQEQNYNTCFRQEEGFCTTEYFESLSGTGGPADKFDLPGSNGANSDVTCNNNNAFISIQGASSTGNPPFTSNEFCGRTFNSIDDSAATGIVRTSQTPFEVRTFSGTNALTRDGYQLDFRQLPC